MNRTLISTFAVDQENSGRYWGQNQFFALIRGRGFSFPNSTEEIKLVYLASSLIRANYYLLISGYTGAILETILKPSGNSIAIIRRILESVEYSEQRRNDILNQALNMQTFSFPLPILLTNVLMQASSKEDILTVVFQMRSSRAAKRFRQWVKKLQDSILNGDRVKVEESLITLKKSGIEMSKELGDKELYRIPIECMV